MTGRLVQILEKVRDQLDHGSTGAANLKKAAEHGVSTAHARKKLKDLQALNKKSRTATTTVQAHKGYPSVSSKR